MNKRWKVLIPIIFVGVIIIILLLLKGCGKTKSADNKTTEEEMTEGEVQEAEHTAEDNGMTQAKPQATTQVQGTMQADKQDITKQGGTTQQTIDAKPDEPTTEQPKPQTPVQPHAPETTEAPEQSQTPPATTTEQATMEQTTTEPVAVWVVDQPAWDEVVPIYEQRCRMICASCGGYMYSVEDIEAHPCVSSRYDDFYDVQVGTQTIHHDEIGHWEYR